MSRTFSATEWFGVPPAEAFALMCDRDFLTYLLENSGGIDAQALVTPGTADGCDIQLDRALPADVPSFAKAVVGDQLMVRETRSWGAPTSDGSRTGHLTVTFDGAPVSISGDLSLSPEGEGCWLTVSGEVKAAIPLIGGKVEEFARDQLVRFVAREEELAERWLSGAA